MISDLFVAGAAGKTAIQDFAKLVNLLPRDDAGLQRIPKTCLLILNDRLSVIGNDKICPADGLVIILTTTGPEPSTFDQRYVRANNGGDVLPGLDPFTVENGDVAIGRTNNDITPRMTSRGLSTGVMGVVIIGLTRSQKARRFSILGSGKPY